MATAAASKRLMLELNFSFVLNSSSSSMGVASTSSHISV